MLRLFVSNKICLRSAERKAKSLGLNTLLLTSFLKGEAREVAHVLASIVKEIKFFDTLAIDIQGMDSVFMVAYATDARDGPTDSAGAIVSRDTIARAQKLGLDPLAYLKENDSYHFF